MATDLERLVVRIEAQMKSYESELARANGVTAARTRQIERRFAEMNRQVSAGAQAMAARVSGILGALGLTVGSAEILRYADAWTNAGNRIAAVGVPLEQVAATQDDLADIARRSRSEFGAVVDLYAKLSGGAAELGVNQEQIARVTETVSKALVLGGTSSAEAAGAITQLGQALASGTLRGDELNSILEQSPPLARLIAKEFGITVGQLREYGKDGKLQARAVFDAILNGSRDVDAAFGRTQTTVGQAVTNLTTSITEYIGKLDSGTGASAAFANGILGLSENMETVADGALVAGLAITSAFSPAALGRAVAGLRLLGAAALANPFTAMLAAIVALSSAIVVFGDEIRPIAGELATIQDYTVVLAETAGEAGQALVDAFVGAASMISEALGGAEVSGADIADFMVQVSDRIIGAFIAAYKAIKAIFEELPGAIAQAVVNAANFLIESIEAAINKAISALNSLIGAVNSAAGSLGVGGLELIPNVDLGGIEGAGRAAGSRLGAALGEAANAASAPYLEGLFGSLREKANARAAARTYRSYEDGRNQARLDGQESQGAGATAVTSGAESGSGRGGGRGSRRERTPFDDFQTRTNQRVEALRLEAEALARFGGNAEKARLYVEGLMAAQEQGIAITDAVRQRIEAQAEAYASASLETEKFSTAQEQAAKAAESLADETKDVLGGLISDLRSGADAGEAFANVLDRIADKAINAALDSLFSGGGIFGAIFGGGRASGGPVRAGMAYRVGETGPETFVPSVNGRIVPDRARMAGAGSVVYQGGAITINADGADPAQLARLTDEVKQLRATQATAAVSAVRAQQLGRPIR